MQGGRTDESDYLLRMGRQILEPYTKLPSARAAMITGSAAEGISDRFSDLDMTVYYEGDLPSEATLARIREENGAPERAWFMGERAEGNIAEAYELDGVQAQIGHVTITAWENDIAEVLERWNADTPLHKAMSGTLECVAVQGEAYVERWKARIRDYPEELARAMVERWLRFFPVWYVQDALEARDATLWHFQIRTETAYNLIGILAGLNRLYFTTFQFKKMRRFLDGMPIKPERLADRLEDVFRQSPVRRRRVPRVPGARGAGAGRAGNAGRRHQRADAAGRRTASAVGVRREPALSWRVTRRRGRLDLRHRQVMVHCNSAAPVAGASIPFTVRPVSGGMAVGETDPGEVDRVGMD